MRDLSDILRRSVAVFLILFATPPVLAGDASSPQFPNSSSSVDADSWPCWQEAADRYGVDVLVLYAIAKVESGARSGLINYNGTSSYDMGVMQINSWWLPKLKSWGITAEDLMVDACLNVHVGAWILSQTIERYGYTWRGIGAYNAVTDWKRARYARKVAKQLDKLVALYRLESTGAGGSK